MIGRAAPVLTGPRVVLRPFEVGDLDAQAAAMADPAVTRHLGGRTFDREDTWRRILASPGMWALLGYGYWVVARRDDGRYLGQVGFADFKRDMTPSIEGLPEMGWIFARQGQGQGFASEAVKIALAWADGTLRAPEVVAIIDRDNARSIRVAEQADFVADGEAYYREERVLLFRRQRPSKL